RTIMCLGAAKGDISRATAIAFNRYDDPSVGMLLEKAAVTANTTSNSEGLVIAGANEFMGLLQPQTILGSLPRIKKVPPQTGLVMASAGMTGGWVAEGNLFRAGILAWGALSLPLRKAG